MGQLEDPVKNTTTRLLLMVSVALLLVLSANAATITVTNTDDSGPGSLRQAVNDAASGDTITFAVTGTIRLTSGEILIAAKGVTIEGPGPELLTISGNNASRVFNINANLAAHPVSIRGLTISNGRSAANGGAISFSSGDLFVDNCVFSHNSVQDDGVTDGGDGGGLYIDAAGSVTVTDSRFTNNTTYRNGGGIYLGSGLMTVSDSIFAGNTAGTGLSPRGGAIYWGNGQAAIERSSFVGNVAGSGAGIFLSHGGDVGFSTVIDSFFSGNSTFFDTSAVGGGIYNERSLTVKRSTFYQNIAGNGAGIYNASGLFIDNSTFSSNANGSIGASVVFSTDAATVMTVASSTFFRNFGTTISTLGIAAFIKNSVIVGNPGVPACGDGIESLSRNFATDNSCGVFTQVTAEQLKLDALADNGGPTPTHRLLPGSVAIDAAFDCTDVEGITLATDQRGVPRPQGATCDVGAFELEDDGGPQASTTSLDPPPATQYSDVLALHATTQVNGSPASGGTMEFFLDDVSLGTDNVDETGAASLSRQLLLPPGAYPVRAEFTSDDPAVAGSVDTTTLVVSAESAVVVPKAGNPAVIEAHGGTFSGTVGPFCFEISELADGSPGDTSTITEIDPSLLGSVGGAQFGGFTRSGGGAQARVICYSITLSGAAPGNYVAQAAISGGENYTGFGASPFQIVNPAALAADLLVSVGVDKLNVKQGDLLTYTLTVRNFGPHTAFNVVVNDTLSTGSTFVSASANRGTFTAPRVGQTGTVTWYPGNFAASNEESTQIVVTVIAKGPTTITNTATASLDNPDPNLANNTATIATNVDKAGGGGKKK
jgi:uncharacterized repeat protein (TIGR01451 family)